MSRKVIFDCDPGVDDCIALMAALASPEDFEVLGISTVAGNVPLEVCTRNALALTALVGRDDVGVYAGCPRPMVEKAVAAAHIHGETGLGAARLPEPSHAASDVHAVDFIIDALRAADAGSVTLAPTGPLTNIAVALVKAPDIARGIKEIVLMGGARSEGGNITASAEFNMYADPHAARVVFQSGLPITAIGLDTTLQLRCTPGRHTALETMGNEAGAIAAQMIGHVNQIYGEIYGAEGAALHDPCVVAYLIAPELFETKPAFVEVETRAGLTRGHTSVDVYAKPEDANARWATKVDAEAVFALLYERIARL
jgi:purine nucleosidase